MVSGFQTRFLVAAGLLAGLLAGLGAGLGAELLGYFRTGFLQEVARLEQLLAL